MSVKLMAEVWECDFEHAEQSVLLAMADHARDDGTKVFPSLPYVAWKTGYSSRQVPRIVAKLRAMGCLVVVEESRQHRPTEYRIDLSGVARKPKFQPKTQPEGSQSRPDKMSVLENPAMTSGTPDMTSATPRHDIAMSYEPLEPSIEPKPSPPLPSSEERIEPVLQLTPLQEVPSQKTKPKKKRAGEVDPRWQAFIDMWLRFYHSQSGDKGGFTPADGQQLKRFLKENPTLAVEEFRRWLNFYRLWPKANPAAKAREVLPRLHLHRFGPLDEFGKPLRSRLKVVDVESASTRYRREMAQELEASLAKHGPDPRLERQLAKLKAAEER